MTGNFAWEAKKGYGALSTLELFFMPFVGWHLAAQALNGFNLTPMIHRNHPERVIECSCPH